MKRAQAWLGLAAIAILDAQCTDVWVATLHAGVDLTARSTTPPSGSPNPLPTSPASPSAVLRSPSGRSTGRSS
jgi:hypothetical protein